jgi:hypothetical protein
MFKHAIEMLQGLIDGTAPLPPPFPPRLNFLKEPRTAKALAANVALRARWQRLPLTDTELRYLLFKVASYLRSIKRHNRPLNVSGIIDDIWPAISLTLSSNPNWLTSKAGVQWAIDHHRMWLYKMEKQARAEGGEPVRVAELEWNPGFYFVELTTGLHVRDEGLALGHCMSWSLNREAVEKHGLPHAGSPEALECLTYAVKLRHRELRLFSLRGPTHNAPLMTIAYSIDDKSITDTKALGGADCYNWTPYTCAMVKSLSAVVEIDFKKVRHGHGCYRNCPGNGWCQGRIVFYDELTAFRSAEGLGGDDAS